MKANEKFLKQPKRFWANVRTLSEALGYTEKKTKQIKVPTISNIVLALQGMGLNASHIVDENKQLTEFGRTLLEYFEFRADVLNNYVKSYLMDVQKARAVYTELHAKFNPTQKSPMNKQKGKKKDIAFFTGIINILVEAYVEGLPCNYDPHKLTTVTFEKVPLRTLARRVDGAFPSTVNPIAVWEIKEYYYTTTFGSRVADGVYETLLDGLELEELREHENIDVKHYLFVDDYNTWWNAGRSYLCRMIDMLHMGYVDEVIFGAEALERIPELAQSWVKIIRNRPEFIKAVNEQAESWETPDTEQE